MDGFVCMTTLDPGGAKGVCCNQIVQRDMHEFTVDGHSKFKARKACEQRWFHSTIGKSIWRIDNPPLK